jgi:oligopeptidase A
MSNPLLTFTGLPPFSKIKPEYVEPAIDELLSRNRKLIHDLLAQHQDPNGITWDNFVQPIEEADDHLNRVWSPISHMNSVVNSDALRDAYNACLPKLSDYATEMGQNEELFHAYNNLKNNKKEFEKLTTAQKKIIENALLDFKLSGFDLHDDKKKRFKEIQQQLSQLTTKFEENVLDATHAWNKHISDETNLSGLPESARAMAKQAAEQKDLDGWLFTLDFPSYYAVMSYADDPELRREMYEAYVTRASDQGPNAHTYDNSQVMENILALRHEAAQLLGFKNYAERSLAKKMADSPEHVINFLSELADKSHKVAQQDYNELVEYAKQHHGQSDLNAWDLTYYSEKLREHKYDINQETLKPYFPETRVVPGMFEVVKRLYDIHIEEVDAVDTWHKDVRFYEIKDHDGNLRGQFYLDLYAREKKRGGAWMDDCQGRNTLANGETQIPVAYLTCNLSQPIGDKPALFTHDEVTTLFHEFGHGLHHMLTQVDHIGVSGINGVAWDAVELPSQFMENWCWEREALDLITGHFETGETLPQALFDKMLAAKNFQAGMQMVRQLEFALFDFKLHADYDPELGARVQETLDDVRKQVAVIKAPSFNRFQHSFTHIFAGGYAAGYYSYKWAEVLSADAFSKFEEHGIFDQKTGAEFLSSILEKGGSQEPMELFVAFRGREPSIDPLLRHSGIAA